MARQGWPPHTEQRKSPDPHVAALSPVPSMQPGHAGAPYTFVEGMNLHQVHTPSSCQFSPSWQCHLVSTSYVRGRHLGLSVSEFTWFFGLIITFQLLPWGLFLFLVRVQAGRAVGS